MPASDGKTELQLAITDYGGSTMRNLLVVELLLALVMPALALGQSDFDGTWKIDLNRSQLPTETQVFLLQ